MPGAAGDNRRLLAGPHPLYLYFSHALIASSFLSWQLRAAGPRPVQKGAWSSPASPLILVDWLPAWMLGCYGGKEVHTPNIDRLFDTGVRFRNHFAASPPPGPAAPRC